MEEYAPMNFNAVNVKQPQRRVFLKQKASQGEIWDTEQACSEIKGLCLKACKEPESVQSVGIVSQPFCTAET